MKYAQHNIAEVSWCATKLRKKVRQGSKVQLLAELLYEYAIETQGLIDMISRNMALEDLETTIFR